VAIAAVEAFRRYDRICIIQLFREIEEAQDLVGRHGKADLILHPVVANGDGAGGRHPRRERPQGRQKVQIG